MGVVYRWSFSTACFASLVMAIRVRFAPSPTGILHLGGARTALFNYLFARANRGRYVLRVEDTDKARFVAGSIRRLESSLHWLGISFDEGPSIGGRHGPYCQSERLELYRQVARELTQKEAVYPCFCSKKRLQTLRTGTGYDRHCRGLSQTQVTEKLQMGVPCTLRLKVPLEGTEVIKDQVYGEVRVANESLDDQVLLKADGWPTYHLASVVDDHFMEISHVMRGQEWLTSTAKHQLVYKSLGWDPPSFAHLPLLLSRSGGKLSKRNQDVFVENYQTKGYLPEAMVNFLALLGWSPRTDKELFTNEELIQVFSLEGISKNSVTVDEDKLMWMNKQYWKACVQQPARLRQLALELKDLLTTHLIISEPDDPRLSIKHLEDVLTLMEDRVPFLSEIPQKAGFFWKDPVLTKESFSFVKVKEPSQVLKDTRSSLEVCDDFTSATVIRVLKELSQNQGIVYSQLMLLCRVALTGIKTSPALGSIIQLLGKPTVLHRLQTAGELLKA